MAYDEHLMERLRGLFSHRDDVDERLMFGTCCLMVGGHLCCGAKGDELIVRVGPESSRLVAEPGAREFADRPMRNWLVVGTDAIAEDAGLERWVRRAEAFVDSRPPKELGGVQASA